MTLYFNKRFASLWNHIKLFMVNYFFSNFIAFLKKKLFHYKRLNLNMNNNI